MKFKKTLIAIAFSITSVTSFAQGVPTIDAAGLAQAIMMVDNMKTQVENQISQLRQIEAQVTAMTGSRGMGGLLNDPSLRYYLPDQWQGIYDQVKAGNYGGSQYQRIYDEYGINTDNQAAIELYEKDAANTALLISSYENTIRRLDNIQGLVQRIDSTTDIKAAADLQNRIAAEQAIIQNEQNRVNLMMNLAEAERKATQERARRSFAEQYIK